MKFRGSIVALITPLNSDYSLDVESLQNLVHWHIEQGTNAIVAMGTTGESATLPKEIYTESIKIIVEEAAGRIPVIAGVTAMTTETVISNIKLVESLGVDGTLLAPPYYIKPPQRAIISHYEQAAASSALPMILYNVPGRTCVDLSHETVVHLSKIDNIVAIKDATAELNRLAESKAVIDESFGLLSGDDPTAAEYMLKGGHGVISVTANIAPKQMAKLCELAVDGDKAGAELVNDQLAMLHDKLFVEANPIPAKWCLATMNKIKNIIAPPLVTMDEQYAEELMAAMNKANLEGELA